MLQGSNLDLSLTHEDNAAQDSLEYSCCVQIAWDISSLSSKGTRKTFPDEEITTDADTSTHFELAQRVIPVDEVPRPVDL